MSGSSDPAYEPGADLPATRPPRPAAPGHLVGRVQAAAVRVEPRGRDFGSETVLSFRLLDTGEAGPREVELRGRTISGSVHDGDWVEVPARQAAGRLEVAALANLTTGSQVSAPGSPTTAGARLFRIVFVGIFVLILLVFLAVVLGFAGVFGQDWPFGDGGLLGFGDGGGDAGGSGDPWWVEPDDGTGR